MKAIPYLAFLLLSFPSLSQNTYDEVSQSTVAPKKKKYYLAASFEYSSLFHTQDNGALGLTIPYLATIYSGATSHQTFKSNLSKPFSSSMNTIGLDLHVGSRKHFFDLNLGGGGYCGIFLVAGYGKIINRYDPLWGVLVFKASVNIGFYQISKNFGRIDNQHKAITILGQQLDSLYDYETTSGFNGTTDVTDNAQQIVVSYRQNEVALLPKLNAEYHPFKNSFFIGVSLRYYLPISEIGEINLVQNNGSSAHNGKDYDFDLKKVNLTYSNRSQTKTPYSLRGFQAGISVGLAIFDKK